MRRPPKLDFLTFVIILSLLTFALSIIKIAFAHDPSDPFAEWMMSLHQPDNPVASCCGPADQFYATEYYEDSTVSGGFVVVVDGFDEPIHVPPEKVNWSDVNPTGRGVIFVSTSWRESSRVGAYVYCFVPGTGT